MNKTILITGSTDGIGLATAKMLVEQGHNVLLHGRNAAKLAEVEKNLSAVSSDGSVESYVADLSNMTDVATFAKSVAEKYSKIDVLINTLAPYLLTQRLLPLLGASSRVINLSSAAQSPVDLDALTGKTKLSDDFTAYAQSKLAITMWSRYLALSLKDKGRPMIVAVNPGSLLGTKMVKEGFGTEGKDIGIGSDILIKATLDDEFKTASGQYFDNDSGQFASPHSDALDTEKCEAVVQTIESVLA